MDQGLKNGGYYMHQFQFISPKLEFFGEKVGGGEPILLAVFIEDFQYYRKNVVLCLYLNYLYGCPSQGRDSVWEKEVKIKQTRDCGVYSSCQCVF